MDVFGFFFIVDRELNGSFLNTLACYSAETKFKTISR